MPVSFLLCALDTAVTSQMGFKGVKEYTPPFGGAAACARRRERIDEGHLGDKPPQQLQLLFPFYR